MDPNADTPATEDTGAPQENARPEWLPEKFWTDEGPNVENLAKSYAELERTRGANLDELKSQWEQERMAGRPESADAYALPEIEELDSEALAASPIVSVWRNIAHEAGLPQEAFEKALSEYAKAEVARIEGQLTAEMEKLGDNAQVRASAVSSWAQTTFTDPDEFAAVQQIGTTAAGVKVLEKLMKMAGDSGGNPADFEEGGQQQETLEDIRKLMDSREYWDPKQRNPAVVKKVEAFFERQARK